MIDRIQNRRNKKFAYDTIETFRDTVFDPSIPDIPTFFQHLALTLQEAFQAKAVYLWDNNVYGRCLVHLVSSPEDNDRVIEYQTLSRETSFTGLAIEQCDVIIHHDLSQPLGNRHLHFSDIFQRHGVSKMVSIPVFDAFNLSLVDFVMNLFFDENEVDLFHLQDRTRLADKHTKAIEWLSWSVAVSLDHLLYRIDDRMRHRVEEEEKRHRLNLGRISQPSSGLAGLFQALIPDLQRWTGSDAITLYCLEPFQNRLAVETSTDTHTLSIERSSALTTPTEQLFQVCVDQGKALLLEEPFLYPSLPSGTVRWTFMAVPVLSTSQKVLGVLVCHNAGGYSFSSHNIRSLENFARVFGPPMERFLLLRQESPLPAVIAEVSEALPQTDHLMDILQTMMDAIVKAFNAETSSLYLLESQTDGSEKLIIRAATGVSAKLLGTAIYDIGEGITGTIAQDKQVIRTESYHNHSKWRGKYNPTLWPEELGRKGETFLGLPIQLRDKLIGVWKVENIHPTEAHPDRDFTDEDVRMAQVLSSFLAYVIEHRKLVETTERQFSEWTDQAIARSRFIVAETLSGMVVHSIGHKIRDLRDRIGTENQNVGNRNKSQLQPVYEEITRQLDAGYKEITAALGFIFESPPTAESTELHKAIEHILERWYRMPMTNQCTIKTVFNATSTLSRIPEYQFRELLVILMGNSVQAGAKKIEIRTYNAKEIETNPENYILEAICVEIEDDGTGISANDVERIFEPSYTTKGQIGTGLGLFIGQRLARMAGGDLNLLESQLGRTIFQLVLPVWIA